MDLSSTTNIKTLKLEKWLTKTRRNDCEQSNCWNQTPNGKDDYAVQDEARTHKEQEHERVKGKGGSRQSLKHIDGNVPMCMYNRNKDVELESKKNARTRGQGGCRQPYRHVEGDTPMCVRNIGNEARSKENEKNISKRANCEGGSEKTEKMQNMNAKAQAPTAALKQ